MDQELYSLIGRARRGDKDAFAQLVDRYKENVYRYAYGMLADRMEAEDVVQEAFIKAYLSLPKLDTVYAFSSWLSRIVSNLCYDRIQKRKKVTVSPGELMETAMTTSSIEDKELQMSIEEAMGKLSPEQREAVILRDVQGYTYDEIADMLGVPPGTVKSRIHAGRLMLRREMKPEAGA